MKKELQKSIDLFAANEKLAQQNFKWENETDNAVCALEYSAKGMKIDIDRIKAACDIIKHKVGPLSIFRGHARLTLAAQMAQSTDMEGYFDYVKNIYEFVSKGKVISSPCYVLVAMLIAQNADGNLEKAKQYAEKINALYLSMMEKHPLLTSPEDMGMAALMVVSNLEENAVMDEMENCYAYLKAAKIGESNTIQSISHILCLKEGNYKEKCEKVIALNKALAARDRKFGASFTQSILGALVLTGVDTQTLVNEIVETDDYLQQHSEAFGFWRLGKKQRLMYAGILVMEQYCQADMTDENEKGNTLAVVIATQLAALMEMELMMMTTMVVCNCHA